ncbi:glycosyltransferase family 2 protein [Nocardioides solisilvae]|uniref:glycosyltransferase family 2 protein n=1 Tax=Nocardioides solisilvae TaxID=1542435 RepID=UPI0013A5986F|nr:glycosyltransferase family 2 protein [Nocardioides solisilvae]
MSRVDVVVVTYQSVHVVGALLDSLPAAMAGQEHATVVVDNGSTDGTRELVAARSDCLLVESGNHGYSAGINAGVAALAGTGPVLVLNPDLTLAPGSVPRLVDALRDPAHGVAAPRVLSPDGSLFLSLRREPTLGRALGLGGTRHPALSERLDDPAAYETPRTVDWALGACLLVDRACHDLLGGWDESFFLYSEETDFCLRARDAGLRTVYVPDAVVTHVGGGSGQSPAIHAMQIVNRVRLYRRRHRLPASLLYYALALASEGSKAVRGERRSRTALVSLLVPRRRPPELRCGDGLLPR